MTTVQIPISEQVAQRFRSLPGPQQQAITNKVTSLLIQELEQIEAPTGTLSDFQEAMQMSDDDMRLTFGDEYLTQRHWQPANA